MNAEATDGKNELEYFVRLANKACDEAYSDLAGPMQFIEAIDSLYMELLPQLSKAKPATAAILLLNAHASLRAAIRLSLSGQLLPMFMALRGSMESALYSNAMVVEPSLADVWLHRDRDEASKKLCRNKFTFGNVIDLFAKAHDKDFADSVREAYELTIDFGAHPNSRSMLASIHLEEGAENIAVEFTYIHAADSMEVRQSLVACAETGLVIFLVSLLCVYKEIEFESLNLRALDLQKAVPQFVASLGLSTKGKSS